MSKLIPELNLLGKTYDVANGKFADPSSAKEVIIDWGKVTSFDEHMVAGVTYKVPKFVDYTNITETTFTSVSGESMSNYLENLTARVGIEGKYLLFKSSFSADFSSESARNLANTFTRISSLVKYYVLKLPTVQDYKELRQTLKKDFVDYLNTGDAAKVFKDYGTHMIGSIIVGGRASFLYTTDSRKFTSSQSIGATAEMSSEFLMGKTEAKYKTAHEEMSKSSEYKVTTVGGDPQYGNAKLLDHIQEWEGSIKNFLRFIDVADSSIAYIPLWQLAEKEERRTELKRAMEKYLSENQAKDLDLGKYIDAELVSAEAGLNYDYMIGRTLYFYGPDLSSDTFYLAQGFSVNQVFQQTAHRTTREVVPKLLDFTKPKVLRIKEKVKGALAYPTSWEVIERHDDGSIHYPYVNKYFRPVFSGPYVALSDIFVSTPKQDEKDFPPNEQFVKQFRGIHKSAVTQGSFGVRYDFENQTNKSFWAVQDKEKKFPPTWLLAGKEPAITPYALKADKVNLK